METEIQDNNSDLGFHEAALLLNWLLMVIVEEELRHLLQSKS